MSQRDILMVLPPDFHAPEQQKRHRFPPLGPAIVAAALAEDGYRVRIGDLEQSVYKRAPAFAELLGDEDALLGFATGTAPSPDVEALLDELLGRLDPAGCEFVAFSADRHTQAYITLALAQAVKRKWKRRTVVGGAAAARAFAIATEAGVEGLDVVTSAEFPADVRATFDAAREVAPNRWGHAFDPAPRRRDGSIVEWPTPDFSGFDLESYRHDPFNGLPDRFPTYAGQMGSVLILPFRVAVGCQYRCSFCQNGGVQSASPMEEAVRQLGEISERYGVSNFMMFDTQINAHADAFAAALREARLGIHWTDSYRVAPNRPGTLEAMAEAGCIGLTVGVESASDRMLRLMVKGHREAQATRLVEQAHGLEMMLRVNLLTAFPQETREDHQHTCDWVEANAYGIDELAPSSFYLVESPVTERPERFNITIRGDRKVGGDYKFRKMYGAFAYDEIGGMTWEEREQSLRTQEHELFDAWAAGRGRLSRVGAMTSAMMFAMRQTFATKAEAYAVALEAARRPDEPLPAVDLPRVESSATPVDAPVMVRQRLGPIRVGAFVPRTAWRVVAVERRDGAGEVLLSGPDGDVRFGVGARSASRRAGVFEHGAVSVWYYPTEVPFAAFEFAGRFIAAKFHAALDGAGLAERLAAWDADETAGASASAQPAMG